MPNSCFASSSTASSVRSTVENQSIKQNLRKNHKEEKKIDTAIYSYVQAIRTLNRTTISANQIAKALNLPYWKVTAGIERLQNQGIKIVKIC